MAVKLIVFDLTRLIERRDNVTPTGIDRVDLRCALDLALDGGYESVFVRQAGAKLCLIDREKATTFLEALRRRWNDGSREPAPASPA